MNNAGAGVTRALRQFMGSCAVRQDFLPG